MAGMRYQEKQHLLKLLKILTSKGMKLMSELTGQEKQKHGNGFGGYSSKKAFDYQVSWREKLERDQAKSINP